VTLPPLEARRARDLVARLSGLHVLVVGDVMVDRFIVGKVSRISPEAPVPVVQFRHEYSRLGGAANVAHNLTALGARVTLLGVIGKDEAARRLREALDASSIAGDGLVVDASRPTVEKVRIVTERNQQVARIDYEHDDEVGEKIEGQIVDRITRLAAGAKVVLVSDYLKGAVTKGVMQRLVALKSAAVPLIVDPKIPHLNSYAGASLVTPNHHEAEIATNRRIRSDEDARNAAIDFRKLAQCDAALITRGEHGMWLSSDRIEGAVGAFAREVSDVTGAGDTVVATVALALAAGATLAEAAVLANHAAGVVVAKFGPAAVTPQELLASLPAAQAHS
jgi:D-beta-D-heptose 7-phosphate kinase/D-beta-D-heptose 1-phosphate adenosyltransferase